MLKIYIYCNFAQAGQFEYNVDLPIPVEHHCLARLNDTHFMMAGGRLPSGETTDRAFVFTFTTGLWVEIAPLSQPR